MGDLTGDRLLAGVGVAADSEDGVSELAEFYGEGAADES